MMATILPACVASAERRGDDRPAPLYPQEAALVARAVRGRRREFATVRACAREALAALGLPPAPLLPGPRRAPGWPAGVVGSMTHCDGYRAAAVAHGRDLAGIGVDAEPNAPLPAGVARAVATADERVRLAALIARRGGVAWDRLLFSAKESIYKAWFPLTGRWLGFHDVTVSLEPSGRFRVASRAGGAGFPLDRFEGTWWVGEGFILTAVIVPRGNIDT